MADLTQLLSQFLNGRLPQIGSVGGSASGVLTVNTTSYTTIGTSAEDAWTYSLPANTLGADGRAIRITVFGTLATNANSKSISLTFGATTLYPDTTTASNTAWRYTATL